MVLHIPSQAGPRTKVRLSRRNLGRKRIHLDRFWLSFEPLEARLLLANDISITDFAVFASIQAELGDNVLLSGGFIGSNGSVELGKDSQATAGMRNGGEVKVKDSDART